MHKCGTSFCCPLLCKFNAKSLYLDFKDRYNPAPDLVVLLSANAVRFVLLSANLASYRRSKISGTSSYCPLVWKFSAKTNSIKMYFKGEVGLPTPVHDALLSVNLMQNVIKKMFRQKNSTCCPPDRKINAK
jgi:hypothetical protein